MQTNFSEDSVSEGDLGEKDHWGLFAADRLRLELEPRPVLSPLRTEQKLDQLGVKCWLVEFRETAATDGDVTFGGGGGQFVVFEERVCPGVDAGYDVSFVGQPGDVGSAFCWLKQFMSTLYLP